MHKHPDGPSFDPNYCPQNAPLGRNYNNTVHSCGWFGIWIFEVCLKISDHLYISNYMFLFS